VKRFFIRVLPVDQRGTVGGGVLFPYETIVNKEFKKLVEGLDFAKIALELLSRLFNRRKNSSDG